MTLTTIATLFSAMIILAALPSTSVIAVVSRSLSCGVWHGVSTSAGIVVGDICFIVIAVLGLSVIADAMGDLFLLVTLCAGIYLIWLGSSLWRSKPTTSKIDNVQKASLISSFLCGLLITLGDQKAIFFYMGFFPAFVDLSTISISEVGIIIAIATIAVGGVKIVYALTAVKAGALLKSPKAKLYLNRFAGTAMTVTGGYLLIVSLW